MISSAARRAASVATGFARGVSGASTAWPRAFAALAASAGLGLRGRQRGVVEHDLRPHARRVGRDARPGSRWPVVISAAESVVGTATTRRGGSAAASALATSITRPPPSATRVGSRTAPRRPAATSSTRPGRHLVHGGGALGQRGRGRGRARAVVSRA